MEICESISLQWVWHCFPRYTNNYHSLSHYITHSPHKSFKTQTLLIQCIDLCRLHRSVTIRIRKIICYACKWFLWCHETTRDNENAKLRLKSCNSKINFTFHAFFVVVVVVLLSFVRTRAHWHNSWHFENVYGFNVWKLYSPRTFLK